MRSPRRLRSGRSRDSGGPQAPVSAHSLSPNRSGAPSVRGSLSSASPETRSRAPTYPVLSRGSQSACASRPSSAARRGRPGRPRARRRPAIAGSFVRTPRSRPRRTGDGGSALPRRRCRPRASTGWRRRSTPRTRGRARSDTRHDQVPRGPADVLVSRSNGNSGVWTPTTTSPCSPYFSDHARTWLSVRSQLMQV